MSRMYGYRPKTKEQAKWEREIRARERKFEEEHSDWSDEELLSYLRNFAAEFDGKLFKNNVPGSTYIGKRFNTWHDALKMADLPIPEGHNPAALIGYSKDQQKKMMDGIKQQQRIRSREKQKLSVFED